jgi:hypothetical protein
MGESPWETRTLKGLFEGDNPLPAPRLIQERIHFLGFVAEREYSESEIGTIGYYLANWHLFSTDAEAREAFASYPLRPPSP